MKLSQLINDLTVLADRVGGSYDVKLRVDDDNSFGHEMTNFWIEERVNDVALVADTAELIYEDEDPSPRIIQHEMTNFWIEERVNDVALVADTAELIYEDEDPSPRIIQVATKTIQNGRVWNGDEIKSEPHK